MSLNLLETTLKVNLAVYLAHFGKAYMEEKSWHDFTHFEVDKY